MSMQPEDSAPGTKRLQREMNDLISVLALPAIWRGNEPSQIVQILLDALLRILSLDFAYARLTEGFGATPLEFLRVAEDSKVCLPHQKLGNLLGSFLADLAQDSFRAPASFSAGRKAFGVEDISVFPAPLGIEGEIGAIVLGCHRHGFPQKSERLLLTAAANQASLGLQEARLLSEQKQISAELDRRVAERTAELATVNEELRKEIAERRLAEQKLRQEEQELKRSEEKWRSVFENSAVGVALADLRGRLIAANAVFESMVGYSEDELKRLTFLDITHEDSIEENRKLIDELIAGKRQQFQIEKRYRCKDGAFVWARNNVAIVRDAEGIPQFLMALSEEITERKHAEEKLRQSELNLRQMTETIPEMLWSATQEGAVDYCNARFLEYTGRPAEAVMGDGWQKTVHPDDAARVAPLWMSSVRTGTLYHVEVRYLRAADQSYRWCLTSALPVLDQHGRIQKWYGAVVDVHDWKLAQEQLRNSQADLARVMRVMTVGALTASIAHEVNQPLSGIVTNAGTCLRMLDANPPNIQGARETARRTIRDANRASEVITRLRALYSKKDPSPESMDLNEAAREVTALSVSELQRSQVALRLQLAEDLPPVVGDRIQLQQVILNLLRNAADAMSTIDDRPRELVVTTELDKGNQVRLSVRDSGVGLAPQGADRIFEAFYTTKSDGMGIGLSISRSIVEAHRGRIWAAANDGPGSTFSFAIPCAAEGWSDAATAVNRTDSSTDAA